MTPSAIVTWGSFRRLLTQTPASIATTMNSLLGLTGPDAISTLKFTILGDYFCDKLPFSAGWKGLMYVNSGYTDFKLGGLFVVRCGCGLSHIEEKLNTLFPARLQKRSPHQVFTGYSEQFVPVTRFYSPTLATYNSAYVLSPFLPSVQVHRLTVIYLTETSPTRLILILITSSTPVRTISTKYRTVFSSAPSAPIGLMSPVY